MGVRDSGRGSFWGLGYTSPGRRGRGHTGPKRSAPPFGGWGTQAPVDGTCRLCHGPARPPAGHPSHGERSPPRTKAVIRTPEPASGSTWIATSLSTRYRSTMSEALRGGPHQQSRQPRPGTCSPSGARPWHSVPVDGAGGHAPHPGRYPPGVCGSPAPPDGGGATLAPNRMLLAADGGGGQGSEGSAGTCMLPSTTASATLRMVRRRSMEVFWIQRNASG